ncbi:dihydroxyacetone kinase subunit L [Blautia liquoris]|jgi:dihydroxyacetone kinase-like protein|uniref:phosphoenolpyruvate--glycerone phosphotransferase n=1 Tax=Blautia liquoris TaxID=2779518 RepID=A0A7M2RE53_9FIRM|nr:dihydroxyacetone kinase subunit L [Blautia liquoris]QOV18605.1 dihydroxyacetone kinase subunit L [Blautia liquoris]
MNASDLKGILSKISGIMNENKEYLTELDQQNGDGDLGISMSSGFNTVVLKLNTFEEKDLGRLMMACSSTFNEAAPSSLGTIISIGMMGMAKELKGKEEANLNEAAIAMEKGLEKIMDKAKSKVGEKTILDALCPAISVLLVSSEKNRDIFMKAYEAAEKGSESTRKMRSVHGRAAYYGDKSIGILDGGSVVGKLIFKGIYSYYCP